MLETTTNIYRRKRLIIDLSLILAVSILVALPVYFNGIPGGNDMPQHFQFAKTYQESVAGGTLYPSWAMQPNGGNGDIGIRFYPPLTHYVFMLFHNLTGNWYDGFFLSVILFFFAGGAGVYFLARQWFAEAASLFGAITYIFLPYHVNQIYGAGMYAEFAAAAIAPFCFLFTYRVCRRSRPSDVCGLGVAYSLLILTHLPLTVMCSVALAFFFFFSLGGVKVVPAMLRAAAGVLIALLLSGFYWSRMITELSYVNHSSPVYSSGHFSFQGHFLLSRLMPFTGATVQATSSYNDQTFLFALAILVSAAAIYYFGTRAERDFRLANVAALGTVAVFMATPLSFFVWQNVSLFQKTQFPFRWLTLVELAAAIFAAAAFSPAIGYFRNSKKIPALVLGGLWVFNLTFNVTDVMNPLITYPKDYFNPLPERWKSMPSNMCWWTIWAKSVDKRVLSISERLPQQVLIENRGFEVVRWTATERVFIIDEGAAGPAKVAVFYYPRWKAAVNGQPVELAPTESGLVTLDVPGGKAEVSIRFEEPFFVIAAFYVSGFLWIMITAFLIAGAFRSLKKAKEIV